MIPATTACRTVMPKGRVFISYAKADAKKADKIAGCLEERGVECWIAPRDVKPGAAYGDEIIRGIETSSAFILVLSNASNESDFVAREVERAISKKKPVIPVRIAKVEPSRALQLFISGSQWVDVFSGKLATHMDRLAARFAEEAPAPVPETATLAAKTGLSSRWLWGAGAAVAVAIAAVVIVLAWPASQPAAPTADKAQGADPSVIDNPVVLRQEVPQVADAPGVSTHGPGTAPADSAGAEPPIDIAKTPDDWSVPANADAAVPADQGYSASEPPAESGGSGPSPYGQ
jgi:hypothetical protein